MLTNDLRTCSAAEGTLETEIVIGEPVCDVDPPFQCAFAGNTLRVFDATVRFPAERRAVLGWLRSGKLDVLDAKGLAHGRPAEIVQDGCVGRHTEIRHNVPVFAWRTATRALIARHAVSGQSPSGWR